VVLFESRTATGPWGASADVYNIPTRNYALDANFTDPAKLPPGTPEARTLIRSQWAILPPNQVQ